MAWRGVVVVVSDDATEYSVGDAVGGGVAMTCETWRVERRGWSFIYVEIDTPTQGQKKSTLHVTFYIA